MNNGYSRKVGKQKEDSKILSPNSTVLDNLQDYYALRQEVGAFGQLGGGPKT